MGRYFLKISYDGSGYAGWQRQLNAVSVQQKLEEVLSMVLRDKILVVGSSRTDTGVHAIGQIAQIDFQPDESLPQLLFKINMALPEDIAISGIWQVKSDAQCRFNALSRTYQYRIQRSKNPIGRQFSHYWYGLLDLDSMRTCCEMILKYRDFKAFSKVQTQVNHFECQVEFARWVELESGLLIFEIKANRFLRGMVRALVGTMLEVGKGKKSISEFEEILQKKDRKLAGENAPAKGLCLMEVDYPSTLYL